MRCCDNAARSHICKEWLEGGAGDKARFTDYKEVDRLIAEVTPLFALFGLGKAHMPDSFGVVMGEVKSMLVDIEVLASIDKEDLVH